MSQYYANTDVTELVNMIKDEQAARESADDALNKRIEALESIDIPDPDPDPVLATVYLQNDYGDEFDYVQQWEGDDIIFVTENAVKAYVYGYIAGGDGIFWEETVYDPDNVVIDNEDIRGIEGKVRFKCRVWSDEDGDSDASAACWVEIKQETIEPPIIEPGDNKIYVSGTDNVMQAFESANPGDEIIFTEPGSEYDIRTINVNKKNITVSVMGEGPRPILKVRGGGDAFNLQGDSSYFKVSDLRLSSWDRNPIDGDFDKSEWGSEPMLGGSGLRIMPGTVAEGVYFDNVVIDHFSKNIVTQGEESNPDKIKNLTLNNCIIAYAHNHWEKDASGWYADYVTDLNIYNTIWYHNGWHPDVPGSVDTNRNHNNYLNSRIYGQVNIKNCVYAYGSLVGVQCRFNDPAFIEDNVFIGNAFGFYFKQGWAKRNLICNSRPVANPQVSTGFGLELKGSPNARTNDRMLIEDMLICNKDKDSSGWGEACQLVDGGTTDGDGNQKYGPYIDFVNTGIINWPGDNDKTRINVQSGEYTQLDLVVAEKFSEQDVYTDPNTYPGGLDRWMEKMLWREKDEEYPGTDSLLEHCGVK